MTAIVIADITTTPVVGDSCDTLGTGTFDVLMESVNLQIDKQWNNSRLTGADYAVVYLGALQAVLKESVQFALSSRTAALRAEEIAASTLRNDTANVAQVAKLDADTALATQKKITEVTQTVDPTGGAAKDKKDLMAAQALGFANNTKQSILKTMLDGYSTNLAIAGVANVPETTRDGAIDQLAQDILTNLGSSVTIQTVPETPDVDTGLSEILP